MNRQEQIKRLTWKYFWQQKIKEICYGVEYFIVAYLCMGWIFGLVFLVFAFEDDLWNGFIYTGNWWAFIPIILWIIFLFIVITDAFIYWIDENWEKASKRAKKELK